MIADRYWLDGQKPVNPHVFHFFGMFSGKGFDVLNDPLAKVAP